MKSPIPIVRIVLLSVMSFCPWLYGQNVPDADFRGIWAPCNKFSDTAAVPAGTVLFQDLYFDGKPGQVKNASLLLELPVDMPLIRYRDTRAAKLKAPSKLIDHGRVTHDGQAYIAYEITLPQKAIDRYLGKYIWWRIRIWADTAALPVGWTGTVRWQLKTANGLTKQKAFTVTIVDVPSLTHRPSHYKLYAEIFHPLGPPTDRDELAAYLAVMQRVGFDGGRFCRPDPGADLVAVAAELHLDLHDDMSLWGYHVRGGNTDANNLAVGPDGEILERYWSPEYCINGGHDYMANYLQRYIDRAEQGIVKGLSVDFEPHNLGGPRGSFDAASLERFTEETGINVSGMTGRDILEHYKTQWFDFRLRQNARWVRSWHDAIKAVDPSIQTIMVSAKLNGPPGSDAYKQGNVEGKSLDPRMWDDFIDIHAPMIYCAGTTFYDAIACNRQYLKASFMPYVYPGYSWNHQDVVPGLLSLFALKADGAIFYTGGAMLDGENLKQIAIAARAMGACEDIVYNGTAIGDNIVTIEPVSQTVIQKGDRQWTLNAAGGEKLWRANAYEHNGAFVAAIFNFQQNTPLTATITLPLKNNTTYDVVRLVTQQRICPDAQTMIWSADALREGLMGDIAANTAELFVFRPQRMDGEFQDIVYKTILDTCAQRKSTRTITIPQDKPSEPWRFDLTNEKLLSINGPQDTIAVDCTDGMVRSWHSGRSQRQWVQDDTGMGIGRFWYPRPLRNLGHQTGGYALAAAQRNENGALVTLEKTYHVEAINGLHERKTFALTDTPGVLEVTVDFTNTAKTPMTFSYWVHNRPAFALGDTDRGDVLNVQIDTVGGPATFIGRMPDSITFAGAGFKDGVYNTADVLQIAATITGDTLGIVSDNHGTMTARWDDPQTVLQGYVWRGATLYTLEWMHVPVTLAPGKTVQYHYRLTAADPPAGTE